MNKKLGILLLAMLLGFAACGDGGKEAGNNDTEPTKAVTVTETPEATATPEPTVTPEPTATPVPAEPDYAALAVQAENMVKDYVEALKAGDVETILSMTKPDSDLYKELSLIKDYETTEAFLQAMFAGSCYYVEGTPEDMERNVRNAIEGGDSDFYLLYVDLAMPDKLHFSEFVPNAMFDDGEQIPEEYAPANNEEAMQVVKAVAKELPLTLQNMKLTTPDENGKMYVKSGSQYFDFLFDTLYESDLTEEFVTNYVTKETRFLGGKIVNSPDGVYEEDDEIWKQLMPMIEQKDMNGMFEYHITLTGKDLRDSSENTFVYGDVKNLTPEQQAYVDSFVDRIVFYHCDLTWEKSKERDSDLMYIVPVLDYDEEKQAWLLENNITEVKDVYIFEPDRCIETLTHPYFAAALHAKDDEVPALIPAWSGKQEEGAGEESEGIEEPESFVTEMLYTVTLTDVGTEKIKAIKLYRDVTGAGLAEAKAAVESTPCLLLETSEQAAAEKVRADFEAIGATIAVNIEVADGKELPKEDGRYVITLLDAGTEKVKVIKAYREATGLGLKECKDAVESTPCTVTEVTNKVDAELIAATFTAVGATVEITEAE